MIRNAIHNAFLNTLTMETAFPRVSLEMTYDTYILILAFVDTHQRIVVCLWVGPIESFPVVTPDSQPQLLSYVRLQGRI